MLLMILKCIDGMLKTKCKLKKVDSTQLEDLQNNGTPPEYDAYWLNSDSSSRPCHSVIDNAPYRMMSSESQSFCNAAFAYLKRCSNAGATIKMPTLCM